jgi:hypothetical protein
MSLRRVPLYCHPESKMNESNINQRGTTKQSFSNRLNGSIKKFVEIASSRYVRTPPFSELENHNSVQFVLRLRSKRYKMSKYDGIFVLFLENICKNTMIAIICQ